MTRRELLAWIPASAALRAARAADVPFDRIDVHLHIHRSAPAILAGMQKTGWRGLSICVCGGIAAEPYDLEAQIQGTIRAHRESKGRLAWAAAFDARGFEAPDFSGRMIADLRKCFDQGALGVKIWKNLGMAIRSKSGQYLLPDDRKLLPIYEAIQKADRTLLVHVADGSGNWMPPRPDAKTSTGAPSWWTFYGRPGAPDDWWRMHGRPGAPTKEELLLSRDRILSRNPKLRVVGVHLGSNEDDLVALAKRLDTYPNFAVDVAARVRSFTTVDRETARQFLMKHQDRVVYGSDYIFQDDLTDAEGWKGVSVAQEREWNFFASDQAIQFGGGAGGRFPSREVQGLALPERVLRKIFYDNPVRWLPGILG